MPDNIKPISEILKEAIEYYKLEDSKDRGRIVDSYKEIVGETIAKVSKVKKFDNGILFIEVENPSWKNELFMMREILIEKINKTLNKPLIKEIRFK